jgi:serine/threonine-protein kinase
MTSERTALTRIDPASQKTVGHQPASDFAASPGPRPTIPEVELDKEIGRGGMGVVFSGRQTYLDRRVAVKLLLVNREAADDDYVRRFQREAKILAGLSHPHIVSCYSAGLTAERQPYLVMEFIDGPNLKNWVAEHGPLAERDALRVVRELAQALGHAHANGIIHRDVKPENVLLAKREGDSSLFPYQAKLVDLGLARPQGTGSDMNLTGTGQIMGTPSTMAPEQFDDPEGVDFRADIYGLGCVLYHALTARPAFSGKSIAQIVTAKISGAAPNPTAEIEGLSSAIGTLVADMLAKDREQRPQSYELLMARCHPLLNGANGANGAAGGNRLPWVVIAGVGVAAAGILALLLVPRVPVVAPTNSTTPMTSSFAAPTISVKPPTSAPTSAPTELGAPQSLLGNDVGMRLKKWTIAKGAQWSVSEATDHGIAGVSGRITRPLEAGPWIIAATLRPANGAEATEKTDEFTLGVQLSNGESIYLRMTNLGATTVLKIERSYAKPEVDPEIIITGSTAPGELTLELAYAEQFLRVSYNGTPFEKKIGLASDPTELFLSTTGPAAVEVLDLTIRRPVVTKP